MKNAYKLGRTIEKYWFSHLIMQDTQQQGHTRT